MLTVYSRFTSAPSKIITDNDAYFNINSVVMDVKQLYTIEHATYVSPDKYQTCVDDTVLSKRSLCTGMKTLFNIMQHSDICFDVMSCGRNALEAIYQLTTGIIYTQTAFAVPLLHDEICDVCYHDVHYTSLMALQEFMFKEVV